ncbi:MAG: hypothetical protein HGB19_12525 [Chlorobiales bacterium]|nr:hypothetical protein [Chlorobiales bacterium]
MEKTLITPHAIPFDQFFSDEQDCTTPEMCQVVVGQVNDYLATRPVYDDPMPSDVAQRELLELIIYAKKVRPVARVLQKFLNLGAPILLSDIDHVATETAGKLVMNYYIEETMKRLLLTCRAGKFVNGELQ